jgi:hypothetical protein
MAPIHIVIARPFQDHMAGELGLDLSRFDAAPLIAFIATKETDYKNETDGRISQRCRADRVGQWAEA